MIRSISERQYIKQETPAQHRAAPGFLAIIKLINLVFDATDAHPIRLKAI